MKLYWEIKEHLRFIFFFRRYCILLFDDRMCIALVIRNNVVSIVIGICLCMNALIIFYSFIDRMLAKVGLENFHMINYTVSGKITLLGTEITSEMAVTSLLVGFAFVAAAVCLGKFCV